MVASLIGIDIVTVQVYVISMIPEKYSPRYLSISKHALVIKFISDSALVSEVR